MACGKLGPALAAGCTVVLKPAEQTPLSTIILGELALEAGFPEGVINVITGYGRTAGAALASHMDVDKVAFTGSTVTGRAIIEASKSNFKRVSLELGGKSPTFIFADADLKKAIPAAAMGIFFNAGQVCAAGSRLFVQEEVADQVLEGIAGMAKMLRVGHTLDPETMIGPLVSEVQLDRVTGYIESGRQEGATVLGRRRAQGRARLVRRADRTGRYRSRHEGAQGRDLRPGAVRDPVLVRGRCRQAGRARQRDRIRPQCHDLDQGHRHGPPSSRAGSGRATCASTAPAGSTRRCRSAATRRAAGAARTARRGSRPTPNSRRCRWSWTRRDTPMSVSRAAEIIALEEALDERLQDHAAVWRSSDSWLEVARQWSAVVWDKRGKPRTGIAGA
jgi:hypothetical protein